jgi:tRNA modification GTPase
MIDHDTIAAISTAPGRSALAVVRISGPESGLIGERLGLVRAEPRRSVLTAVKHPEDGRTVDRVVAVRFAAPASYTGEDMLELCSHGGALAPQLVLDAVCAAGARQAEPGEFTRRAFLNGRMDLLQAEATLDLIEARSRAMHRAALFQLERGLSGRIDELRLGLIEIQALLAYDIDFPEEDEGPVEADRIDAAAEGLLEGIHRMLELAPEGELLRDGALTVIAGRPNSGKSSIFNMLLGFERAIVTEEPGTTRDAIEALVSLGGYPFRLVDTAGLRADADRIEEMGIEVARSYLERADLVLLCVEAGRELGPDEREFAERQLNTGGHMIVLRTKADLIEPERNGDPEATTDASGRRKEVPISAHTGIGIPELRAELLGAAFSGLRESEDAPLVTRGRQIRCLRRAAENTEGFLHARSSGLPAEVAATHMQDATLALENLLGVVSTEDVLDAVFSEFCVGK